MNKVELYMDSYGRVFLPNGLEPAGVRKHRMDEVVAAVYRAGVTNPDKISEITWYNADEIRDILRHLNLAKES